MFHRLIVILGCSVLVSAAVAQSQQRRATMTSNGNSSQGKCTIEVVVDGVAEVEVSGDSAVIRNESGQQPQWRRFECTGRMPANPVNFHFSGVDGRGRQQLVRSPQNGGAAVVRIEDKNGGSEAYTFDITWEGGSGNGYPGAGNDRFPGPQGRDRGDQQGERYRRFGTDQALRACQDAVRQQAAERFRGATLEFQNTPAGDQQGRRDQVGGTFDVRNRGQGETYRYSCSVDFEGGQIRSAQIEALQNGRDSRDFGGRGAYSSRQIQTCERAVSDRFRQDGYSNVDIESINADSSQGRGDWIVGTARANRGDRSESFSFTCSLDRGSMSVRSVDVKRR